MIFFLFFFSHAWPRGTRGEGPADPLGEAVEDVSSASDVIGKNALIRLALLQMLRNPLVFQHLQLRLELLFFLLLLLFFFRILLLLLLRVVVWSGVVWLGVSGMGGGV